jgi:hypothetical protein
MVIRAMPFRQFEWMRNFKLGRTEIHDFDRSAKSPIDHIDDDILFLLRTFPFHTVRTVAEPLIVRPSPIPRYLRGSLGSQCYHFRCVPCELTFHLKEKRVVMCHELLKLLQMEETFGFARVVTGDE